MEEMECETTALGQDEDGCLKIAWDMVQIGGAINSTPKRVNLFDPVKSTMGGYPVELMPHSFS